MCDISNVQFDAVQLKIELKELLLTKEAMSTLLQYQQLSFRNRSELTENGFADGVQRIYDYPDNVEHDFKYWYRKTPAYFLHCLKQIEELLQGEYVIGRVRIMLQAPKTNLGLHVDEFNTFRLHVPILTHENALFVTGAEKTGLSVLRMPVEGKLYQLDTTVYHSSLNLDETRDRYHLLVNILPLQESA